MQKREKLFLNPPDLLILACVLSISTISLLSVIRDSFKVDPMRSKVMLSILFKVVFYFEPRTSKSEICQITLFDVFENLIALKTVQKSFKKLCQKVRKKFVKKFDKNFFK